MKTTLSFALILILLAQPLTALAQDGDSNVQTLRNADILTMLRAKIPADIILDKIKSSRCNFDTFPGVLAELKYKGVPDEVLRAMVMAPVGRMPAKKEVKVPPAEVPEIEAASLAPAEVMIPASTAIEIEMQNGVSSKELEDGSHIYFVVSRPVRVNGLVVIEQGARARAIVSKASGGRSFGRPGELLWRMQDVLAVDGTRVPLEFTRASEGQSETGDVKKKMVLTGIYAGPAALFWGFKKGKAATIPAGKQFDVSVSADTVVKGVAHVQPAVALAAGPAAVSAPARSPDDGLPEYGDISEIRKMRRVYVSADDIDSQNRLIRSLSSYEGVSVVGSPDRADFFISFGQGSEATRIVPRGFFSGTIDKNRKAQFIVYYRAESGRMRIVWQETEDIQTHSGISFSRANEVNVIRHFVKALKAERGER